ncbi:N-acetylglucosaminylphosphatidylinositol deacetylase, partial [Tremellales sp. Uapishka_1]
MVYKARGVHSGDEKDTVGVKKTPMMSRWRPRRYLSFSGAILLLLLALSLSGPRYHGPPGSFAFGTNAISQPPPSALILTAHPDDEAMFFSPTILHLVETGWEIRAICLSTGNAAGLGEKRSKELYASYEVLGVPQSHVELVDNELLQDGMTGWHQWQPAIIANIVSRHLSHHPASIMITFDSTGITHHPNHTPLHLSHTLLPPRNRTSPTSLPRPRLLVLKSPPLATKFTGPLWILVDRIKRLADPTRESHTFVADLKGYKRGIEAMLQHQSQLVWFRWLYLAFSRLMWINELVEA